MFPTELNTDFKKISFKGAGGGTLDLNTLGTMHKGLGSSTWSLPIVGKLLEW